jgi:hypothetical protein
MPGWPVSMTRAGNISLGSTTATAFVPLLTTNTTALSPALNTDRLPRWAFPWTKVLGVTLNVRAGVPAAAPFGWREIDVPVTAVTVPGIPLNTTWVPWGFTKLI